MPKKDICVCFRLAAEELYRLLPCSWLLLESSQSFALF